MKQYKTKKLPKYSLGADINTVVGAGAPLLNAIPGIGPALSAGVGLLSSGLNTFDAFGDKRRAAKEEERRAEEARKFQDKQLRYVAESSQIKQYPTQGVATYSMYKYGGVPNAQYEVEKGEVIQGNGVELEQGNQIASDMHSVGGQSHKNGGTEGKGGERVYSDAMKISPILLQGLDSMKFKIKPNSTYADVAKKLGNLKGKLEDKAKSYDKAANNTAKIMGERIDSTLEAAFNEQEMTKAYTTKQPTYRMGGKLPKFEGGFDLLKLINPNQYANQLPMSPLTGEKYSLMSDLAPRTAMSAMETIQPGQFETPEPNFSLKGGETELPTTATPTSDKLSVANNINWSNIASQGINLLNYFGNKKDINKMKTDLKPVYTPAPSYNYVDRSGQARKDNATALTTTMTSLNSASPQMGANNKLGAFASYLGNNNQIAQGENLRKDSYDENFNRRLDSVTAQNIQTANITNEQNLGRYNDKVAYGVSNRSTLFSNIQMAERDRKMMDLDKTKALLTALGQGDTGVINRLLEKYPDLASKLGLQIKK